MRHETPILESLLTHPTPWYMLTSTMGITRIKERIIAAKISEEIKCEAIQKRHEITGSYP